MPTATASDSARQRCARARLASPEIHCESPVRRRDLAVERHRGLEDDERAAGAGVLAEGLVEQPRGVADLAVDEARPRCPRRAGCRGRGPAAFGRRVVGRDHHARDAGLDDRVGAGRRAARGGSRARATRTCVAPAGSSAQSPSAIALGVRARPAAGVEALADHAARLDDHGADERVRARLPARPAGQLDGPLEVARVALCGGDIGHSERLCEQLIDSRVNITSGPPARGPPAAPI